MSFFVREVFSKDEEKILDIGFATLNKVISSVSDDESLGVSLYLRDVKGAFLSIASMRKEMFFVQLLLEVMFLSVLFRRLMGYVVILERLQRKHFYMVKKD